MPGDNPINNEKWKLHGSHSEYWRSDNPLIAAWYRFGEDEYPISATVGQPELTDSGPRHHHLASNKAQNSYITHVSGIAPWSASGIQFGGSWTDSSTDRALRANSDYYRDRTDFSTLGYYGIGSAIISGITIMGWVQVPDTNTNRTSLKKVWSNIEDSISITDGEWLINLDYDNHVMSFHYNSFGTSVSPGGATVVLQSSDNGSPFEAFPFDEPFFFACQLNKGNPPSNLGLGEGSGVMKMFFGTTTSGLFQVAESPTIVPDTNFWRGDNTMRNNTQFPYTIGADPQSARGSANTRNLPAGSIVDEFVIVNDGNMSLERMAHYMNSGIIQDEQDPLGLTQEFETALPGTDDLVAYWTFDEQGGANTSPNTPEFVNLDMQLDGVSFVDGVRGGSGIRPNKQFSSASSQTFPTDKNGLPHVIGGSGLNFLFPEHDQTWIGWIRSEGVSDLGGAIGWFGPTSDKHVCAYWGTYIFSAGSSRPQHIDMQVTPSGGSVEDSASIAGIGTAGSPNVARSMNAGDWHLVALVFDITHGYMRVVYDATDVYPCLMNQGYEVSGITKEWLLGSGPDRAGWVLTNISSTSRCSYDDWAVYDRILTLPEMSGYALSGIAIAPSPYATSDIRTMGYWELQNSGTYIDPSGEERIRYDDSSFYVHNLSTISGVFSQSDALNSRVGSKATKIEHSGSMLGMLRLEHGANLDFSQRLNFATSGFTAGCWLYVPSGDFGDVDNANTSGLYGDHHVMGAWNQAEDQRAWQLGVRDNTPFVRVRGADDNDLETTTTDTIPFNKAFFIGAMVTPSGGGIRTQIFLREDGDSLRQVADDTAGSFTHLTSVGASGYSMLNVPNMQQGFPSGTRMQVPFVYAGPLMAEGLDVVQLRGFNIIARSSGEVSVTDPDNISHWKLDFAGKQFRDYGRAQNVLTLINTDEANSTNVNAIHTSGVSVREAEYLDTLPGNPSTSGLDLGASSSESFTILGWLRPNSVPSVIGDEIIFSKHGTRGSGYQTWLEGGGNMFITNAGGIETSGNNSEILERDRFNHLAVVHDKDSNRQTIFVNARYAGTVFTPLADVPTSTSGFALGGPGSDSLQAIEGGGAFSGILDDWMVFTRALSLPEISGLAANTYNFTESQGSTQSGPVGAWISGISVNVVSGLVSAWIHGSAQDVELAAAWMSGVEGVNTPVGGYIRGRASASGFPGGWIHGQSSQSGVFGFFLHGLDIASGVVGAYTYGACQVDGQFDIAFTFQIISADDFDAKLAVELTRAREFDAHLDIFRITAPPTCTLELPYPQTVVSGLPYSLTVQGSGAALDGKRVEQVRFTFADFKGAASGTRIAGTETSGFYTATRVIDTQGLYTVKIEVIDEFGYRTSCAQQVLVIGSGDTMPTSGQVLAGFPGIAISVSPISGVTKEIVSFTHAISGISTTSGVLEYTDYSDGQESLVNSLEMPDTSIFGKAITAGVRQHEYSMPGKYTPVWAASGSWGIVSDTVADGFDFQNF